MQRYINQKPYFAI